MAITTAHDKRRPSQILLAVGMVELLRPLFVRWASDGARQVYEQICRSFASGGRLRAKLDELLESIDSLPEAHCDDSHYRDYHVMLALSVLDSAAKVRCRPPGSASVEFDELEAVIEVAEDELEIAPSVAELRARAGRLASLGDVELAEEGMREMAKSLATMVDVSLDVVEEKYAWPPDRWRWNLNEPA